jgi:hypothetical protein
MGSKYNDRNWASPSYDPTDTSQDNVQDDGLSGRDVLHAFEAASVGYLAYNYHTKKQERQRQEAIKARARERYIAPMKLRKIIAIDLADEPTGIDAPMRGLVSAQVYMRVMTAYAEGIPLQITWESEVDDKLHTDRLWVDSYDDVWLTASRPRTPEELASFDRLRREEANAAYQKERQDAALAEIERIAAKAARGPWYKRLFG